MAPHNIRKNTLGLVLGRERQSKCGAFCRVNLAYNLSCTFVSLSGIKCILILERFLWQCKTHVLCEIKHLPI